MTRRSRSPSSPSAQASLRVAVVGAGIAGLACARTLRQAGCEVVVFDKSRAVGGRTATRHTVFGGFDHGAQYFTVRDPRFERALQATEAPVRPWSVSTVRVLDPFGRVLAAAPPPRESHWVPTPGMRALAEHWAAPLQDERPEALALGQRVVRLQADAPGGRRWALTLETADEAATTEVRGGFDQVLLAMPAAQALTLLTDSGLASEWCERLRAVEVAPCWTLMLAYPQAMQPGLGQLGPQWNAARSTHHRIRWLTRESSKPGREPVERWTVQASAEWSARHLEDDAERVVAKLLRGMAEVTGIRATPAHAVAHRWRHAQTQAPLGEAFLWDRQAGLGLCGDWCLGHRVENAFVSGLELALATV